MKRKGFTLIELLAVIVVLAVIVLIATPIVTKTIENSKRGAAIESVRNMIETAELYFITANPKYGKLNLLDEKLNYNGQKPELGEVELNKDGDSKIYAYVSGYCVTKEFNSELYASKMNKEDCNWFATDNYETTEGTTFTLNNQSVKNYLIYGNSIQKTRSGKNLLDMDDFNASFTDGYYESTATNFKLAAGKTYTLSFDFSVVSATTTLTTGIGYGTNHYSTDMVYGQAYPNQKAGRQTVTFTTPTDLADGNYLFVRFIRTNSLASVDVAISLIQLEEGNSATSYEPYGTMPSPEFPSEIKSTGDLLTSSNCASYGSDACNNVGKYVIQVKSRGNNLFDGKAIQGAYLLRDGVYAGVTNYICNANKIYVEPNKDYYITRDSGQQGYIQIVLAYDANNTYIGSLELTDVGNGKKFTTPSNVRYINFDIVKNSAYDTINPSELGNVQISENNSQYEEYKEKVTNIYLDEPLRKIGDYADYIDFNNKKIVRKVTFLVIDGFSSYIPSKKSEVCWFSVKKANKHAVDGKVLSPILKSLQESWWQNSEGIISHKINASGIYLSLNWDRLGLTYDGENVYSNDDINKTTPLSDAVLYDNASKYFTQKFSEGYRTIYYPLDTPTEESIDLPNIEVLDGSSTLSINTDVNPSNVKLTTSK